MTIPRRHTVLEDGFAVLDSGIRHDELVASRAALEPLLADQPDRGGVRDIATRAPEVFASLLGALKSLARPYFDADPFAVRAILFDKTPVANWKVAWHQDVTIAVTASGEAAGWGPWSRKQGTWHVRPPAPILAGMLTLRLHLDPCGASSGPVRVLPGSHRLGRLSDAEIAATVRDGSPFECVAECGGVLAMRPLLLHSSHAATAPSRRRVLHVEFADTPLPGGFQWAERDGKPTAPHAE